MSEDPKPAQPDQTEPDPAQGEASRCGSDESEQSGRVDQGDSGEQPRDAGAATGTAVSESEPGEAPPDADGRVDGDEQSLAAQLEAAQAEIAEQKDRYLRAAAEADNIRRRADNDIANARKYAIEGFASEILAVRDSLEIARALEISEDDAGAVAKMKEGLDLTLKQLDSALSKFAVEIVDPQKGDKLDPERHQAMTTQESDNVPPNHIVNVLQKGYTIHDRLLRPAMVVVAKKPQDEAHAEDETS